MTAHLPPKTTQSRTQMSEMEQKKHLHNEINDREISVGQRLREIRAMRRLSMRALAEMSGLNINTLSMIENEHTSPSVSTLQQIAQSLQVPISEFFETNNGDKELVHQKQGQRPRVAFEHSTIEDLAAGMSRFSAEPLIVTINPGADSGKNPIVHTGREFVYCIEGHITYTVKNQEFELGPGDSLAFEAYLPHHWKNTASGPSRALLVLCPMDVRDNPTKRHFSK
jgi:transcriptional regulator with XRE-family HTH domain